MKLLLLILTVFTTIVCAQPPLQSRLYVNDEGDVYRYEANLVSSFNNEVAEYFSKDGKTLEKVQSVIPNGFGNLSFGSFGGGSETNVNLLRYNIHYSSNGYIPFYLLVTQKTSASIDTENLKSDLIGTDNGLINIKLADDVYTFNENSPKGLCNFSANPLLSGGCYLNFQLGAKMIEYIDDDGNSDDLYAAYTSLQLAADFPITQGFDDKNLERAGRMIVAAGISAYYANTDKIQPLFPEFEDNNVGKVADLKKFYASLDAGIKFTVTNFIDIEVKASFPLKNKDVFDSQIGVAVTWTPE